jgi:hypothetical protein
MRSKSQWLKNLYPIKNRDAQLDPLKKKTMKSDIMWDIGQMWQIYVGGHPLLPCQKGHLLT